MGTASDYTRNLDPAEVTELPLSPAPRAPGGTVTDLRAMRACPGNVPWEGKFPKVPSASVTQAWAHHLSNAPRPAESPHLLQGGPAQAPEHKNAVVMVVSPFLTASQLPRHLFKPCALSLGFKSSLDNKLGLWLGWGVEKG